MRIRFVYLAAILATVNLIHSTTAFGASFGQAISALCTDADDPLSPQPEDVDALCKGGGQINGVNIGSIEFGSSLTPTDNVNASIVTSASAQATQRSVEERMRDQRSDLPQAGFFFTLDAASGDRDDNNYLIPSSDTDCSGSLDSVCADEIQMGFDYDYVSLLLGYDTRLQDNMILGLAGTLSSGSSLATNSASSSHFEDITIIAYASGNLASGLFWDGSVGLGWGKNRLARSLSYSMEVAATPTAFTTVATAAPEKALYSASAGLGWNVSMQAWTLTPALRLNWSQTEINRYRESANSVTASAEIEAVVINNLLLQVEEQTDKSLTSELSVDFTRAISVSNGVVQPLISLAWIKQYEDSEELTSQFLYQSTTGENFSFTTETPDLDDNYFRAAVGISQQFAQGAASFAQFETILGHSDISQWKLSVGARQEF